MQPIHGIPDEPEPPRGVPGKIRIAHERIEAGASGEYWRGFPERPRNIQASWKLCPESRSYKVSRLRTFFRYCLECGWVGNNPVKGLARPIFIRKGAIPFTAAEVEKVLWATELYCDSPPGRRKQVREFVLVLRYTGLRIGDCVSLRRENITDGKLYLRTAKTGTGVWLPLKREVVEALAEIELSHGFYFWSGEGTLKSGISSWHRSMATLFKLAGVTGHPHMFRHSFATSLLKNGVSVEIVARLMGHGSAVITRKYYDHWIEERQVEAEQAIERAWRLS